jgi:hypothetical protein
MCVRYGLSMYDSAFLLLTVTQDTERDIVLRRRRTGVREGEE